VIYIFYIVNILWKIAKDALADKQNQDIYIGLILIIIAISVINFFSPYLNHPLGIGLFLFLLLIYEAIRSDKGFPNSVALAKK